jgi:hypothetical protein
MHVPARGRGILVRMQAKPKHTNLGENRMNNVKKLIVLMGLLSVLCAIPTMAQIPNKVTFDAPSAFYAGNAKMPAGSYAVTQQGADDSLLLIEDVGGSYSAFVEYVVAPSNTPHAQTDVTFNKYGSVDFLSAIWIQGRNSEMQIVPSKAEKNAAKSAGAEKHSLSAKNTGETK